MPWNDNVRISFCKRVEILNPAFSALRRRFDGIDVHLIIGHVTDYRDTLFWEPKVGVLISVPLKMFMNLDFCTFNTELVSIVSSYGDFTGSSL